MKVKSILFHLVELILVIVLVVSGKLYIEYNHSLEVKPPKASTVEEYFLFNPDKYDKTVEKAKEQGALIEVEGNTYICIYDYSDIPNYTEEYVNGDSFQNFIDEDFKNSEEENIERAKQLARITGIPHLKYIYRGVFNNQIIYEKVYEI